MKIKLDENLGNLGSDLLTAEGHDVSTVAEQRMSGDPDTRIYEVCRDEQRMLVTLDHDFAQTLRFPPEATAGIAVLECKGQLSPGMIRILISALAQLLRLRSIEGQLWIVEPGRVRIHDKR